MALTLANANISYVLLHYCAQTTSFVIRIIEYTYSVKLAIGPVESASETVIGESVVHIGHMEWSESWLSIHHTTIS